MIERLKKNYNYIIFTILSIGLAISIFVSCRLPIENLKDPTTRLDLSLSAMQLTIGLLLGFAAYFIAVKQYKLGKKQIKLGAIQTEINGLTTEMLRLEQQRANANNMFISSALGLSPEKRPEFYTKGLESIEHYKVKAEKVREDLNNQYKLYENEAKK